MSSNRFGAGWHAWWKGDAVHAAMAKTVEKGLRVLAFETRKRARARIVRRGWGQEFQTKTYKNGKYRGRWVEVKKYKVIKRLMSHRGKYAQKTLTTRLRKGIVSMSANRWLMSKAKVQYYKPSRPGESPTNQRGVLKNSILYDFRQNDGQMESFTGAVAMPSSGGGRLAHHSMTDGMASHALEWGGYSRNDRGHMVRIEARPYMRPAANEVLDSHVLRDALTSGLRREFMGANSALDRVYGRQMGV